MKKLSLDKLLIGSLSEAQQKKVLGGVGAGGAAPLVNSYPFTSPSYTCTYVPPSPPKTTNTTPCA